MRLKDTEGKGLRGSKLSQVLGVDLPRCWVRRIQHFALDSGYFRITQVHRHDCFVISLVDVVKFQPTVGASERYVRGRHPIVNGLLDTVDKMDD
jgi:hypothetical protein